MHPLPHWPDKMNRVSRAIYKCIFFACLPPLRLVWDTSMCSLSSQAVTFGGRGWALIRSQAVTGVCGERRQSWLEWQSIVILYDVLTQWTPSVQPGTYKSSLVIPGLCKVQCYIRQFLCRGFTVRILFKSFSSLCHIIPHVRWNGCWNDWTW